MVRLRDSRGFITLDAEDAGVLRQVISGFTSNALRVEVCLRGRVACGK